MSPLCYFIRNKENALRTLYSYNYICKKQVNVIISKCLRNPIMYLKFIRKYVIYIILYINVTRRNKLYTMCVVVVNKDRNNMCLIMIIGKSSKCVYLFSNAQISTLSSLHYLDADEKNTIQN